MSRAPADRGGDAAVVGGGLVGLATALALADRGARVVLISDRRTGEASPAAAGMLAPGVERAGGPAHEFAIAARELYRQLVPMLEARTGIHVPLDLRGIIHIPPDAAAAAARRDLPPDSQWLDAEVLRREEPALRAPHGAAFHPGDGAVDNVMLVRALWELVRRTPAITVVEEPAVAVEPGETRIAVRTAGYNTFVAGKVVLAAGAWAPQLAGLPRALPVEPVRGQMIALGASPVGHVTYAPNGYLVPREGGITAVGATMEYVGFDVGTTPEARQALVAGAIEAAPSFADAPVIDHWSGLRPVTPDFHPVIGPDPEHPGLIYAGGHSRNGILLGPLTGVVVARLATGEEPGYDLSPFSMTRFTPSR